MLHLISLVSVVVGFCCYLSPLLLSLLPYLLRHRERCTIRLVPKLPHEFTVWCCISLLRMITEEWKKNENRCGVSQSKKYGYGMKNAISSARRSLPSAAVEQNTTRTSAQWERKNILCINFFFHFHLEHSRRLRSVGSHCSWVLIFQSFVCSREEIHWIVGGKKIARKSPFGANKERWRCWHQPLFEDIIPNLCRAQSLERNFQCSDELSFLFLAIFIFPSGFGMDLRWQNTYKLIRLNREKSLNCAFISPLRLIQSLILHRFFILSFSPSPGIKQIVRTALLHIHCSMRFSSWKYLCLILLLLWCTSCTYKRTNIPFI